MLRALGIRTLAWINALTSYCLRSELWKSVTLQEVSSIQSANHTDMEPPYVDRFSITKPHTTTRHHPDILMYIQSAKGIKAENRKMGNIAIPPFPAAAFQPPTPPHPPTPAMLRTNLTSLPLAC